MSRFTTTGAGTTPAPDTPNLDRLDQPPPHRWAPEAYAQLLMRALRTGRPTWPITTVELNSNAL